MATQVRKEKYASALQCGERVAHTRKARKMTLKQVAEKTGFSPQQIFLVEKGEINTPVETLARIAEALDVPLVEFFDDHDSPSTRHDEEMPTTVLYTMVSQHYAQVMALLKEHFTQACA